MNQLIVNDTWNFIPTKIGRWWDRTDTEIDIVAVDENSNNIIFGECKYTNDKMNVDVYYNLSADVPPPPLKAAGTISEFQREL